MGSSPLTRGKHDSGRARRPGLRIIPAHAGKTRAYDVGAPHVRDHPRSRGENGKVLIFCRKVWGSSPLTRGKPDQLRKRQDNDGIIPAHAGKTAMAETVAGALGDHPRSRGENKIVPSKTNANMGSSPLTRGKRRRRGRLGGCLGIIPAHAGKTYGGLVAERWERDHPRSRGENSSRPAFNAGAWGSSPLTRGKHGRRGAGAGYLGIIPAHAGKTQSSQTL